MKRLLLLTVMVAIAVSAVALIGLRSSGGPDVAQAAVPQIAIDLVQDTGWCNTIDSTANVNTGATHKAAICLTGSGVPASDFNIIVNYSSTLNSCTSKGQTGTGLDANPDFISSVGTGWDCSGGGLNYPKCGETAGEAFISCGTTTDPGTISGNWAIAVIEWTANSVGPDALTFGTVALYDYPGENILRCPGVDCLGATVTKQVPPPTPTPTALPAECDIGVSAPIAAVPPSLTMKVGAPPAIVNLTASFKNNGAVTAGAPDATCSFSRIYAAEIGTGNPYTDTPVDPTKLGVRVEPVGMPAIYGYGDACFACSAAHPTNTVAQCMLLYGKGMGSYAPGYPPADWDYVPVSCDEGGFNPALPMSVLNESCEDGIDNLGSEEGTCDWGGFSKLCVPPTTPDVDCLDVQAIGLKPAIRAVLAPDATNTTARVAKIECRERGTYSLVLAAGIGSQSLNTTSPFYGPSPDKNPANDMTATIVTVTCTKGPEMVKDCDTDTEGIQTSCNLWLMDPAFAGKTLPEVLPAADPITGCVIAAEGKGCLAVDVWLKSAADEDDINDSDLLPECLGAWEHQIRYDHKIIKFLNDLAPLVDCDTGAADPDGVPWLECEGRLISSVVGDPPVLVNDCLTTVISENWIIEGCVSKDGPDDGMQVGPCGDGIIEQMLIIPQYSDLIYRSAFRPTKDNGVVTNIVDDNCEITDIYAEPMADTLPGGLTPICGDLHITVRMLEGDTDLDCDVDVIDDQTTAFRYGSSFGSQLYDQWFDLEPKLPDQDIDIKDLQYVFGRNYSTCQHPIPDDQANPVSPPP